tara:strand:- start:108 stop:296 length:189 start_codon:yes stop_codon:yes gene_type:complete
MESLLTLVDELASSGSLELVATAAGLPFVAAGLAAYRMAKNKKLDAKDPSTYSNITRLFRRN